MRRAAIAVSLVVLAALGWTAAWFYAAHEANRQLDGWLADEATQHRQWTCPDRAIGGYPTALAISCRKPTFAGTAMGQSVAAGVESLVATMSLAGPSRVAVALTPPFSYRSSDQSIDVHGQWTELDIDLDGLPDLTRGAIRGRDIDARGAFGPQGDQHLASKRLDASFTMPKPGPDPIIDFDIAVGGTDLPQLDTLLGRVEQSDLAFKGRLHKAEFADARTPAEAMEAWRRAGGRIELGSGRIVRGASHAVADGTLGLDEEHRAQGRLQAEFVGLDAVLQNLGVKVRLGGAGAFISKLFGAARPPSEPGGVALPITLRGGALIVGPLKTDVTLTPLY